MVMAQGLASACDLCVAQGPPLSVEAAKARYVVVGSVTGSQLNASGLGGTSDLRIDAYLKADDTFRQRKEIKLPHFFPPNANVKLLVYLDDVRGRLDAYRVIDFPSNRIVKYLEEAPAYREKATPEERAARLLYFFKYLNDTEPALANDAYKEWAMAGNREVGLVAGRLPAAELRAWFLDRKTPAERLSLYGYLLGACGKAEDANLLRNFLNNPDERTSRAMVGLLAGYIHLKPAEGWQLAIDILGDSKKPFTQRHAVLRTLRFYYGFQPDESRDRVLQCLAVMLKQEELLDLAVDQLRLWKVWNYTDTITALYRRPNNAPVTKRCILRYALTCPLPQAKKLVEEVRQQDPDLVNEIQESLQFTLAR
jgi:hypothetical protein